MSEPTPVHVVTVVSRRHLGRARALERALGAFHPGWPVIPFVADAGRDLGVDTPELLRLTALYDEVELCAALKPWALLRVLETGAEVALYLNPGAQPSGPLDRLAAAALAADVALTPRARVEDDPSGALREGAFDARMLAVGQRGKAFLRWWGERLARHCLRSPDEGHWLDQRWLGAALPFFDVAVVRGLSRAFPDDSAEAAPAALDPELRAAYRDALLAAETAGRPEPPNPLTEGEEAFRAWPVKSPPSAAAPPPVETLARGVNLVVRASMTAPLDELAATLAATLAELGVAVATIELRLDGHEGRLEGVHPRLAPYDTTLVCLNPVDLVRFAFHVDAEFFARRRSVGLWLAEETPAPDLRQALGFLDEVWLPSEAAAQGLRNRAAVPVAAYPMPIATDAAPAGRRELGLPEGPVVASVCDLGAVFASGELERANPLGLVEAFERAFAEEEGPSLVVRLVDGGRNRYARERVRLASERRDVLVVDGPLSPGERRALVRACDCYASLHRAADFELAAAEALAAGTPVVASATATMRALAGDGGAFLVPCETAPVPAEAAAYWTPPAWQEPDVGEAALLLRRVLERPDEAHAVAERGRAALAAVGSRDRFAAFLATRLALARPAPGGRLARLLRRAGSR